MLTLYTSIGHLTTQKTQNGTVIPVVQTGGHDYALAPRELLLWSLAFQILTKEEAQVSYINQLVHLNFRMNQTLRTFCEGC